MTDPFHEVKEDIPEASLLDGDLMFENDKYPDRVSIVRIVKKRDLPFDLHKLVGGPQVDLRMVP